MENIAVVLNDGKKDETINIDKSDLDNIKKAIEATAGAFRRWKDAYPIFLQYDWAGVAAFENSQSEERARLHRFIKVQSKEWGKADIEISKAKLAEDDDKKAEHRALAKHWKYQASTIASVAISRMVKYYEADQLTDAEGDEDRGPRARKTPRQKIESFLVDLDKFATREMPEADKRLAREAANALRVVLAGRGVEIPVFGGIPNIPAIAAPRTAGAEQKKAGEVVTITPETV